MTIRLEHTDTFGGEANYCWVRRADVPDRPKGWTDRALVRYAKAWAGMTGMRCRVDNFGDYIAIYPRRGLCQVVFVTWED